MNHQESEHSSHSKFGEEHVSPPHEYLSHSEPSRLMVEYAMMLGGWNYLENLPKGDGHTVLVLPGFTADDSATRFARELLERLGYHVPVWGLGENTGRAEIHHRLYQRFNEIAEESGGPVSVVGHSLGGMYARDLGYRFSDRIRQVVTICSPLRCAVARVFGSRSTSTTNTSLVSLFLGQSGLSARARAHRRCPARRSTAKATA